MSGCRVKNLLPSRLYCRYRNHTGSAAMRMYSPDGSRTLPPVGNYTLPRRIFLIYVTYYRTSLLIIQALYNKILLFYCKTFSLRVIPSFIISRQQSHNLLFQVQSSLHVQDRSCIPNSVLYFQNDRDDHRNLPSPLPLQAGCLEVALLSSRHPHRPDQVQVGQTMQTFRYLAESAHRFPHDNHSSEIHLRSVTHENSDGSG